MEPFEQTSRREFLKKTAAATSGFIVAFHLPQRFLGPLGAYATEKPLDPGTKYPPDAFIQISTDNSVTLTINKLEMGQGIFTSMAQLIVEELECDWNSVRTISAPVNSVYNHPVMPFQMTGGSSSLKSTYLQYRRIGAMMKAMLIQAAAQQWGVAVTECHAEKGSVVHLNKGRLTYGSLAEAASQLAFPLEVTLKDPKDFKVIGKSMKRLDAAEKSNGKAIFGLDVKIPEMVYAVIARPPVIGGKLIHFKDSAARAIAGVVDVIPFGDSVAVLGTNTWAAWKGRDALEVQWDLQGKDSFSSDSLMEDFKKRAGKEGVVVDRRGDALKALQTASRSMIREYEFPYLAHATLEPMNCTIVFDGKKAEIWAGHQSPTSDQESAAVTLGIPKEAVQIHTVFAGGSFGRRASKTSDYVVEAARLVKIVKRPLKIFWTREDDMKGGFYRPMNYHKVEIGFDSKNVLSAWKHQIVGQSVVCDSPIEAMLVKNGFDKTVVEGTANTPYDIPHFICDLQRPTPSVSTLWWRSVGHTHTAYVMETLIDEIAHEMKTDPFTLRFQLLKKSPKHIAVLKLLREKSGWGKAKTKSGRALGLAIHESFDTVVGHVAEVSYEEGAIQVHHVTTAVYCGQVINPEGAKAQIEGAIAYGLSAALYGEIKIAQGKTTTSNFSDYPVLRMKQMPQVDIYFVQTHEPPTGLGEPGLPPIAPAVANAVFQITGKRLRKLPFL